MGDLTDPLAPPAEAKTYISNPVEAFQWDGTDKQKDWPQFAKRAFDAGQVRFRRVGANDQNLRLILNPTSFDPERELSTGWWLAGTVTTPVILRAFTDDQFKFFFHEVVPAP